LVEFKRNLSAADVAFCDGIRFLDSLPSPYTFYDPVVNGGKCYTYETRILNWSNSDYDFKFEFSLGTISDILTLSSYELGTTNLVGTKVLNSPLGFGRENIPPTIGSFGVVEFSGGEFTVAWAINYYPTLEQYGYTCLQFFDKAALTVGSTNKVFSQNIYSTYASGDDIVSSGEFDSYVVRFVGKNINELQLDLKTDPYGNPPTYSGYKSTYVSRIISFIPDSFYAPCLTTASIICTDENIASLPIPFAATDIDVDTISSTVTDIAKGFVVDNGNGSYTSHVNVCGLDCFIIGVHAANFDVFQVVNVTINEVEDAPTFTSTPVISTDKGATYNYTSAASNLDLELNAEVLPKWMNFDQSSGCLTGKFTDV
jgi:hypothetical protein